MSATAVPARERLEPLFRAFQLLFWLYLFMVSIKMMGAGFKTLGTQLDIQGMLLAAAATPAMGVSVGLLVTAIVQSSSFTTSMLVTLVATGVLDLSHAIPMVMGANIGTTITNSLVASAYVARRREFRLAFSVGTVHDIFNLLTVAILLPLEWIFHPLQRIAMFLSRPVQGLFPAEGGTISKGPVNAVVAPFVHLCRDLFAHWFGEQNAVGIGIALLILAVLLLFLALQRMVLVLRQVFMGGVQRVVNEVIFNRWWTALGFGILITALVQSSSMTVSLLVPMVAGGVLTVSQAFPFTLGANIGTTLTAFLAALVAGSSAGITLALTHLIFNVAGTAIFLPLDRIPIGLAGKLAGRIYERRWIAFVYISVVFFLLPIAVIVFSRLILG